MRRAATTATWTARRWLWSGLVLLFPALGVGVASCAYGPAPAYGPPPYDQCANDDECVAQNGANWYCDLGASGGDAAGGDADGGDADVTGVCRTR